MDHQKLFLEHLDLIDRVVRHIARRHHLSSREIEEFNSLVRFKFIDRDFAILRKFEGRSSIATYFTTVIERLYLDFCVARWGRWRPSAAARRLGPVGVRLEQLVGRDDYTFEEAVQTLQTNFGCAASRDELHAMYAQLPLRPQARFATADELAVVAARVGASDAPDAREDDLRFVEHLNALLEQTVSLLWPSDQLVVKLRFQDGLSVAAIARLVHASDGRVHRQLEHSLTTIRKKLIENGITGEDLDRIANHPALTFGRVFDGPRDLDDESV